MGHRASKGDSYHITSRIIGVEVHCGPVHGTFIYFTNNLVAGGANIIIESTRQGIVYIVKNIDRFIYIAQHAMQTIRSEILTHVVT